MDHAMHHPFAGPRMRDIAHGAAGQQSIGKFRTAGGKQQFAILQGDDDRQPVMPDQCVIELLWNG